jgi:uncharacterized membrane protein YcaP (DUF421 family)
MEIVGNVEWARVFKPDTPLLEIFIRGTVTYLGLFILLRLVHKRESGGIGITNILVIVLIADAIQNAMAGDYTSITDGLLLVGVIVFWSWFLDWLGYRVPSLQRFVHPPPLCLVRDGRILRRSLQQELITEDELMSQLRLQGVEDLSEVRRAFIESDGRISVIKSNGERSNPVERRGT